MEWHDYARWFTIPGLAAVGAGMWRMWNSLSGRMDRMEDRHVTTKEFEDHKTQRAAELARMRAVQDAHADRLGKMDIEHASLASDIKHMAGTMDRIETHIGNIYKRLDGKPNGKD